MAPSPFTLLSNKGQSQIIQKIIFLTFQWLCLILYLYKQFLRLGQNWALSYPLLCLPLISRIFCISIKSNSSYISFKYQYYVYWSIQSSKVKILYPSISWLLIKQIKYWDHYWFFCNEQLHRQVQIFFSCQFCFIFSLLFNSLLIYKSQVRY